MFVCLAQLNRSFSRRAVFFFVCLFVCFFFLSRKSVYLDCLRPVHTTPEEFENGGFTLKTHQMFSVHTTPEKFENATITGGRNAWVKPWACAGVTKLTWQSPFRICVWGRPGQTNHLIIVTSLFSKNFVFKMFSVHTKTQSSVFKFLRFQERFRKATFSVDNFSGLVWTESLTGEIKLRFQIPAA